MEDPDHFAVEGRFADEAFHVVTVIEELLPAFATDHQAVRAAAQIGSPALDELAIGGEDGDGVGRLAGFVNGVAEDDAAVGGDDDAVGVAEFKGGGRLEKVVKGFVVKRPATHSRSGWLPLGGGKEEGGGGEKCAAVHGTSVYLRRRMVHSRCP